jgi:hypothetical protein
MAVRLRWALSFVLCALCLVWACVSGPPPLSNSYPSSETLAAAVLEAVERKDANQLAALALNEQEFRDHVWPELPAARPERNLPFSFVWGDLRMKSAVALDQTLARHGGKRYTLVSVRYDGETTRYPSYAVYRETVLRVRDVNGAMSELRLYGSSLEKDQTWKVFSYVVDD